MQPTETFKCVIVEIEDDGDVHIESVSRDGEEADAWLPASEVEPWRRFLGEAFTLNVYVRGDNDVLNEYVWDTPHPSSPRVKRMRRESVFLLILAVALGMLGGDTLAAGPTERSWLYLAAILLSWCGVYLIRKRPSPRKSGKPGHFRTSSDD